jgi:hypothetical protein
MTTDPVADSIKVTAPPIMITALLSQPARARDEISSEVGFAIVVEMEGGKRALMFLPEGVADALEHALVYGHVPPTITVERSQDNALRLGEHISGG